MIIDNYICFVGIRSQREWENFGSMIFFLCGKWAAAYIKRIKGMWHYEFFARYI